MSKALNDLKRARFIVILSLIGVFIIAGVIITIIANGSDSLDYGITYFLIFLGLIALYAILNKIFFKRQIATVKDEELRQKVRSDKE